VKDETENFVTKQTRVSLLHIIDTSRLLEVLRDDDRAIVRAASAASKAADYLLAFRPDTTGPVESTRAADHVLERNRQALCAG
jgi:antirestriction protein ArdC